MRNGVHFLVRKVLLWFDLATHGEGIFEIPILDLFERSAHIVVCTTIDRHILALYTIREFESVQVVQLFQSNGAVASDHELCSRMGVDILEAEGGNAVDAAVTVALCLGVANPASSGMGGGAFILVDIKDGH